jgi:uncharacterized protein (TIGR03086 family)
VTEETGMTEIADRYRRRADAFERKIAAVAPDQWSDPSPCAGWTARDVVDHIVTMHRVMLRPVDREIGDAPPVASDPLGAFRAARVAVEAVLDTADLAATPCDTPAGLMTVEEQIDQVVSDDMPMHGWDLARATGQADAIDPVDVEHLWATILAIPAEVMEKYRTPGGFRSGIEVYGPEVKVAEDAPLQDRLLGLIGRDPAWTPEKR